jgi:hypothetical protein
LKHTRICLCDWQQIELSFPVERVEAAASIHQNPFTGSAVEEDLQDLLPGPRELRQRKCASHEIPVQSIRYAPREPVVAANVISHGPIAAAESSCSWHGRRTESDGRWLRSG